MKYFMFDNETTLYVPEFREEKALLSFVINEKIQPLELYLPEPDSLRFSEKGFLEFRFPMKAISVVGDDDQLENMFAPSIQVAVGVSTDLDEPLVTHAYGSSDRERAYLMVHTGEDYDPLKFRHRDVIRLYLDHVRNADGVDVALSNSRRLGENRNTVMDKTRELALQFAREMAEAKRSTENG